MEALFKHEGKSIDIIAGSNGIQAGEIYIEGALKGVAKVPIPANEQGAISVEGVYDVKKAEAAVFSVGGEVWFDTTSRYAVASSAGSDCVKIGIAVKEANSGAAVVRTALGRLE